jgi:hypothetical protein
LSGFCECKWTWSGRKADQTSPSDRRFRSDRGRLAQLARAPARQAGGHRFEPCIAHSTRPFTKPCGGGRENSNRRETEVSSVLSGFSGAKTCVYALAAPSNFAGHCKPGVPRTQYLRGAWMRHQASHHTEFGRQFGRASRIANYCGPARWHSTCGATGS